MPERETTPAAPGMKISDGMMPALQRAGVMRPGQLGPMSLQPRRGRCAMTSPMSRTGMPSVMQTMSLVPASAASNRASRARDAGTKITATSARMCAIASCTLS